MKIDKLKEVIKNNIGKYDYIAIRGTDQPHEIGETLETSYDWNFDLDVSTYETENPVELGGVSCINLTHDDFYCNNIESDEDMEHVANWMMERINFLLTNYNYECFSIVVSDERNPLGFNENDENEIILADAEVVAVFKR